MSTIPMHVVRWALVAVPLAGAAVVLSTTSMLNNPLTAAVCAGPAALLLVGAYLALWGSSVRIRDMGSAAIAGSAWLGTMLLGLVLTMYTVQFGGSFQDAFLAFPDALLGNLGVSLREALRTDPLLGAVYNSLSWQVRLVLIYFLLIRPRPDLLWNLAWETAVLTSVGLILHMAVPAIGPFVYFGLSGPEPSHLADFIAMRDGSATEAAINGYMSAPSFHIIVTLMICRVSRHMHGALTAAILWLNLAMPLATWVVGDHYITDMVIGAALYGAIVSLSARIAGQPATGAAGAA